MKRNQQPIEIPKEPGPVRTCLGCGKKQLKSLLHRLVLNEAHQPVLDRSQTAPGRGAYLCGPGCLAAATKKKAFHRAFKKNASNKANTAAAQSGGAGGQFETTNLEVDLQSPTKR